MFRGLLKIGGAGAIWPVSRKATKARGSCKYSTQGEKRRHEESGGGVVRCRFGARPDVYRQDPRKLGGPLKSANFKENQVRGEKRQDR